MCCWGNGYEFSISILYFTYNMDLNKLLQRRLKEKNKGLERATDFERRYGTERTYGQAILKEQEKNMKKENKIQKLKELINSQKQDSLHKEKK